MWPTFIKTVQNKLIYVFPEALKDFLLKVMSIFHICVCGLWELYNESNLTWKFHKNSSEQSWNVFTNFWVREKNFFRCNVDDNFGDWGYYFFFMFLSLDDRMWGARHPKTFVKGRKNILLIELRFVMLVKFQFVFLI